MDTKTEKWIIVGGIGVTAYHALSMTFTTLPKIGLLDYSFGNGFSVLTIAAGAAAYGIYFILKKV